MIYDRVMALVSLKNGVWPPVPLLGVPTKALFTQWKISLIEWNPEPFFENTYFSLITLKYFKACSRQRQPLQIHKGPYLLRNLTDCHGIRCKMFLSPQALEVMCSKPIQKAKHPG